MYSQDQLNQAAAISQFVIENGRVETDDSGQVNAESLRVEVEFECGERGLEDCSEIAAVAQL
jgi:hypothetical protein